MPNVEHKDLSGANLHVNNPVANFTSGTINNVTKTGTDTGTETLSNKTLTSPVITNKSSTGTDSGVETLVNKTLTTPIINTPTIAGGSISGITDLAIADGGTGASTPQGVADNILPSTGGWLTSPALTYASADSPTFTMTATGDITTKVYSGVRIKGTQPQPIQNYWSFDTNNADSKGSAVMANIGTPTYTAGKFGNALTLDGATQALSITDAASLHLGASGAEFTVGGWFKTSNTGAYKVIFANYGDNTNANGVVLWITDANKISMAIGDNTANFTSVATGMTTVTDGNWHYAVWSFRNNFSQLYLDGKLEASGYTITPAYSATVYPRIGCNDTNGASNANWFNGQIDDLFIAAYALDEQTIAAKYAAGTAQGTGDLTLTKYFLCTASSYSAPNTTITMYGGTDHSLVNAMISNVYYSTQKAPYGFPLGQDKWTVNSILLGLQPNPTQNTWYSVGSVSLPIGKWLVTYKGRTYTLRGAASFSEARHTFSKTVGETNAEFTWDYILAVSDLIGTAIGTGTITNTAKTTWYVNYQTTYASTTSLSSSILVRATSILL